MQSVALAACCLGSLQGCSLLRFAHGSDYTASPHFAAPGQPWPEARELRVVRWQPMLQHEAWRDHVCAHSLLGAYRFTPLAETALRGSVPVEGSAAGSVSLSDHTGWLVRLRIEPQVASAASTDRGTGRP